MARQEPEAYFLSIRDAVESQRLNQQHINVKAMHNGRLLHQSVPQLRAETRVAEVATGTGAWLHDAIHSNNLEPQSTAEQAQYVGFDISPAQFPAQKIPGVDFAVHDASQPFPEKYHGIFDLVHIRYLVLAIREEQYAQILQNVTQLLRMCPVPGVDKPSDAQQDLEDICIGRKPDLMRTCSWSRHITPWVKRSLSV